MDVFPYQIISDIVQYYQVIVISISILYIDIYQDIRNKYVIVIITSVYLRLSHYYYSVFYLNYIDNNKKKKKKKEKEEKEKEEKKKQIGRAHV